MSSALRAERLVKRYGPTLALDDVSLEIGRAECVALVGESGSGKTTLLRCFNALVRPDAGLVVVGDEDLAHVDPVVLRRHVGYVPQDGGLLPHWTIARNTALVPWLLGRPDAEEAAFRALDRVGLPPAAFGARWPHELSGGQRQRVAIARALAADPAIVLLDEPFGALDAITRADVQATFDAVRRSADVSALVVTHDLHEAFVLADRIAVMRAGRIEQCASPRVLLEAPATPYVVTLLERSRARREWVS